MSDADRALRAASLDLFEQALDRPEAEHAAFLDAACEGNPALRARAEALLRADAEANPIFAARPADLAAVLPVEPVPSFEGRTVGPYRVIHEIGRGGMGTVYLAERDDVGQRVALKLVAGGMASPDRVERFLVERRVLAGLGHPHITRLFDAGVADDGTPWFAMEYVEGEPLDRYCDRQRLSVPDRLALFEQVCEAVAYAHRNLIVHRDLKPSNILVTEVSGAPHVKLLDFGVARLLEDEADGLTRTGARPMTPDFAAPEQILGQPITAATDVYQLGVVLYALVSGHRPYRLGGRTLGEIERQVVRETPVRPSVAVGRRDEATAGDGALDAVSPEAVAERRSTEPGRLRRRLAGDLDAVVMKALAKEPVRRYAQADGLLADLRRYQEGRLVVAQPDSAAYRARRFVGRHPLWVGFTLVLLALTLGFGAFYTARVTAERDQAEAARALAELEADKAEQVSAFLADLLTASDPFESRGEAVTAADLLARGTAEIDALQDQPAVQAEMLAVLGRVYRRLGQYEQAEALLTRSLTLRRALHPQPHPDLAASLSELGIVLELTNRFDQAAALHREALAMRETLFGQEHAEVAQSLSNLALVEGRQGREAEAERLLRRALAIYRRTAGPGDPALGIVTNNLASMATRRGAWVEAADLFRESLAHARAAHGNRHPSVARALSNLGGVLISQGALPEAERTLEEALVLKRELFGPDHPSVASTLAYVCLARTEGGDYAAAEPLCREALTIRGRAFGPDHPRTAQVLVVLGRALTGKGDYAGADAALAEAYSAFREASGPHDSSVGTALTAQAALRLAQGKPEAAEALARESWAIQRRALGERHPETDEAAEAWSAALIALGRYDEVEAALLERLAVLDAECSDEGCTEPTLQSLVTLYEAWGRAEQAAPYHARLTQNANNDI